MTQKLIKLRYLQMTLYGGVILNAPMCYTSSLYIYICKNRICNNTSKKILLHTSIASFRYLLRGQHYAGKKANF